MEQLTTCEEIYKEAAKLSITKEFASEAGRTSWESIANAANAIKDKKVAAQGAIILICLINYSGVNNQLFRGE